MKQAWRGAEARKRTWRDRLHDEELNGFAFAFKARSIAMAVILVWVIASASAARLPALLWMGAMFFAIGWIAYRTRAHPRMLLIQSACAAADVALLLLANHVPQGDVYEWALQIWARRSAFLYLVAYVACSALTFSVVVVLAAGTAAVIGQIASFMFVVYAAEKVDSFKGLAARDPYHLLQQMIALQDIEPWIFMVNQIVLLAVTTGLIASAIWRARQHVERAVQAETQSSNLERYFSPAVAKRLAENVAALDQGRVQDAAVVFVDIVGSIHITEAFPPEEVIAAVRALHRRLVPIVFRRSGIIDKFLGDGMMAVFGAPEPSADAARQAILCAVEVLDEFTNWSERRRQRGELTAGIALGVHWGPVVQGNVGIEDRLEFTTLGDTVHIASRLESMTRHHGAGILLSLEVVRAAEQLGPLPREVSMRCRDLGLHQIDGRTAPVHLVAVV